MIVSIYDIMIFKLYEWNLIGWECFETDYQDTIFAICCNINSIIVSVIHSGCWSIRIGISLIIVILLFIGWKSSNGVELCYIEYIMIFMNQYLNIKYNHYCMTMKLQLIFINQSEYLSYHQFLSTGEKYLIFLIEVVRNDIQVEC